MNLPWFLHTREKYPKNEFYVVDLTKLSNVKELARSLAFYVDIFGKQEGYTDTNEITYWLAQKNSCYKAIAIIKNGIIHGYFQFGYYPGLDLIVVDYYGLKNINGEIAKKLIEDFLNHYYPFKTIVGEVYDPVRMRLFQKYGFRKSVIEYFHPPMEIDSMTFTPSNLVIRTNLNLTDVNEAEIVECIYLKHYLVWYSIYGEYEIKFYNQILNKKLEEMCDVRIRLLMDKIQKL